MTLRIERRRSGDTLIVQLIGGFDVEHLDEVKAQVNDARCPVVIDIGELTLISGEGIRFLNACHIAEWMTLEGRSKQKRQ
jgi:anti-anti-sigma regulatory factor